MAASLLGSSSLDVSGTPVTDSASLITVSAPTLTVESSLRGNQLNLSGTHLLVNGQLSANSMNSTSGAGQITLSGLNTVTVGSGAALTAIGANHASAPGSGGNIAITGNVVDIDGQVLALGGYNTSGSGSLGHGGTVSITGTSSITTGNSSLIYSSGKTVTSGPSYLQNKVELTGGSVAIDGRVYANSRSGDATASDGGLVKVVSTAGDVTVNNGASLAAQGIHGGRIDISSAADTHMDGLLDTSSYSNTAGTVSVAGSHVFIGTTGQVLANGNNSNTTPGSGGTVQVTAANVTHQGQLQAMGGKSTSGTGENGTGGSITITGSTDVTLAAASVIDTSGTPVVNAGTAEKNVIAIQGGSVTVDGQVKAGHFFDGLRAGQGGEVGITATTGNLNLNSGAVVSASGNYVHGGDGGTINLSANTADVVINQGVARSIGYMGSNGGAVNVTAGGNINMTDGGILAGSIDWRGVNTGNGGNINLSAGTDIVMHSTSTAGMLNASGATGADTFSGSPAGNGGNIAFNAGQNITITSDVTSDTLINPLIKAFGAPGAIAGQGGTISFTGQNLSISSNVAESARPLVYAGGGDGIGDSANTGRGGTISSSLSGNLVLNNVILAANAWKKSDNVNDTMTGNGGTVNLQMAGNASLAKTMLEASSIGTGSAGGITINATGSNVNVSESQLIAKAMSPTGQGGTVHLRGLTDLTATNTLFDAQSHTLQAGNSITADATNTIAGGLAIYGAGGINDYVSQVNLSHNGSLTINRLTATNSAITASGPGAALSVSNGLFNQGVANLNATGNLTLSNSTVSSLDTVRMNSTGNGSVSLYNNSISSVTGQVALTGTETGGLYAGNGSGAWNLAGNTITGNTAINASNTVTSSSGYYGGTVTVTGARVDLVASSGSLNLGNVSATAGPVALAATNGNLSATGNITSTSQLSLSATSGSVSTAAATSLSGSQVTLTATNGNIVNQANITAPSISLVANSPGGTVTIQNATLRSLGAGSGGTITASGQGGLSILGGTLDASGSAWGGTVNLQSASGQIQVDSLSTLRTTGQADGTRNRLLLTGGSIQFNGSGIADGNATTGSNGGSINLTATSGAVTVGGLLSAQGQAVNSSANGSGGSVNINAATSFTQQTTSRILVNALGIDGVQALSANGGNITVTAGANVLIQNNNTPMMEAKGVGYPGGGLNGGNGGMITMNANNGIQLTTTQGGGFPLYFDVGGGEAKGNPSYSGNGGTVNLNGSSLSVDRYKSGTSFNVNAGGTKAGARSGSNGHVWHNGAAY